MDDSLLISKTQSGLQNVLDYFVKFCEIMGMELNASKTRCMIFRGQKMCPFSFTASGSTLDVVKHIDYLGIRLQDNIQWGEQLNKSSFLLNNVRVQ